MIVMLLLRDTPQSCGLPPIEKHRHDYPANYSAEHERTFTFKEIFFGYVLTNRFLWAIAIANAFVYFVRYGVVNWIPTYLQTAKGFNFKESGLAWTAYRTGGPSPALFCAAGFRSGLQGAAGTCDPFFSWRSRSRVSLSTA